MDNMLWDNETFRNDYIYFKSVQEYFEYIKENDLIPNFILKEKYTLDNNPENYIETYFSIKNSNLIYTDENHPIAYNSFSLAPNVINPVFFEKHRDEFIKCFQELFDDNLNDDNENYIYFNDLILNDENINKILMNNNKEYVLYIIEGKSLTDEQIKLLKENHIKFEIHKDNEIINISTNKAFLNNTFEELKKKKKLLIDFSKLNDKEVANLDNLIYLNPSAVIELNFKDNVDEKLFYDKIKILLNIMSKHEKKYNITFNVENREILSKSKLLDSLPNNFNIFITYNHEDYDLNTYLEEEKKIDLLVKPIKESNLSPFEKYLAVYNIVKQFKEYKECEEDLKQSRRIKNILNNEYMVCVGYAELLKLLLDKVDIPCEYIGAKVDISYDKGYTMKEIPVTFAGHARNMIKIDDDKYNIHGFYIADSTWDNDLDNDLYSNSIMTFDRKKEAYRMELLNDIDLLFDFHDLNEFKQKISFYINRNVGDTSYNYLKKGKPNGLTPEEYKNEFNNNYLNTYNKLYNTILDNLKNLDYNKFYYFYDKFYNKFDKFSINESFTFKNNPFLNLLNKKQNSLEKNDIDEGTKLLNEFLNEYYQYIIDKVNKKVDNDTIVKAAVEVKKVINNISQEDATIIERDIKDGLNNKDKRSFPYKFDPYSKEAYLDDNVSYDESSKHVR